MRVRQEGSSIILEEVQDFDIGQTLECGQCFHFKKLSDNDYGVSAYGRLLHISQSKDTVTFYKTTAKDFENIWRKYFDLDRDYAQIKQFLISRDARLSEPIQKMQGVRLLNQDFFETLISFIISQNKQIVHIKQIVAEISRRFGTYLGSIAGQDFYSFPDMETLRQVREEELRACRTGFRAPYICDAVRRVYDGEVNAQVLMQQPLDECRESLMQIKGVGVKVANCVMLFGLGRREAFPVDVWIKRIMETIYFEGQATQNAQIEQFAARQFGAYGGYAQQYLFYYGKSVKMGVQTRKTDGGKRSPHKNIKKV